MPSRPKIFTCRAAARIIRSRGSFTARGDGTASQWELQGFGTYNYGHDWRDSTKKVGHEKGRYKYTFSVPSAWEGKSVNIVFEGVMTDAKVKINGELAGPIYQGAFYRADVAPSGR